MIRLTIVEDNPQDIFLLQSLLEKDPGISILGTAENAKSGIQLVRRMQPDVALFDIGLPDMSGVECVKQLAPVCKHTEFIMCSALDNDELIFDSIQNGASSYILKGSSIDFIVTTIKEVHKGLSPMSSDISRKIIGILQKRNQRSDHGISRRESQILELLAKGHTYQEVADALFIAVKTIKSHIYRIYEKLQVDNRTEAVNKYFGR